MRRFGKCYNNCSKQKGSKMNNKLPSIIMNNFDLGRVSDWVKKISGIKGDDLDSIDTFKELTKTIEDMITSLPTIDIPSSVIGKSKFAALKEVVKAYKNTDNTKVAMLACSMTNLIAKHSGAKSVSKIAGFLQNCMALYAIGDTVCARINFKWNTLDQLYVMVSTSEPSFLHMSLDEFREVSKNHNGENSRSINITPSSNLAFIRMMNSKEPMKWFSPIDQTEHVITPVKTNVIECKRMVTAQTDKKDEATDTTVQYVFDERSDQYRHVEGEADVNKRSPVINAVFVFRFDDVEVYATQLVRVREGETGEGTIYVPTSTIKLFWSPVNRRQVISKNEYAGFHKNIELFVEMMFALSIDPSMYLYTFDDGNLKEMLRPVAIPQESVTETIPKIIKAIRVAFNRGLSRSYALVGQPGTGKTIGAQQISNAFPDVCTFKITADVICDKDETESMLRYIKAIKKFIIILDDMDSYNLNEKNDNVISYLNFFDKLNQAAKNDQVSYIFFATINDPTKVNQRIMRRSGRIDEMFEIGLPTENTMRYLFKYNDAIVNKENPTNFDDPKYDDVIKFAIESHITAADITNIFTDIVIYSGADEDTEADEVDADGNEMPLDKEASPVEVCTPEKLRAAIQRVNERNSMSNNCYVSKNKLANFMEEE